MNQLRFGMVAAIVLVATLTSCGFHSGNTNIVSNRPGSMTESRSITGPLQPDLNSKRIVTFEVPAPGMNPRSVATGADGNIWFVQDAPYVGRMTPDGSITEFAIPSGNHATRITAGRHGTLWFAEFRVSKIGRISTDGTIREFGGPQKFDFPSDLTLGSDGNIWFIDSRLCIGRLTPSGAVTLFNVCRTTPNDITGGPGGDVWYTEGPNVGVVTMTGVGTTLFNPKGVGPELTGIAAGPDGNVYVGERSTSPRGLFITQVTPSGVFTRYPSPLRIYELAIGPDNNIWATGVTGTFNCHRCTPVLSKFRLDTHTFSKPVALPGAHAEAQDLTRGLGSIWFPSGTGGYIGQYK
jgi:virginiamycin B lyase